jgi:hypothetical protein
MECMTQWKGDGTQDNANRPTIGDDYAVKKWQDHTGQPSANLQPDPNLYIVYVECEADVLDAIEADGNYFVLWSEEIVEDEELQAAPEPTVAPMRLADVPQGAYMAAESFVATPIIEVGLDDVRQVLEDKGLSADEIERAVQFWKDNIDKGAT